MKSKYLLIILAPAFGILLLTPRLSAAGAKYAPPPKAYSLTDNNSLMKPETVKIYRDDNRVMTDVFVPPSASVPHAIHTRSVLDLQTHKQFSWDPTDSSVPCTSAIVGDEPGDWSGNPFDWRSELVPADLSPYHPRDLGTETVAGLKVKVTEATQPNGSKIRIWVDEKYGLLVKMAGHEPGKPFETALEVTQFSVGKPPAATFDLPKGCGK